MIPVMMVVLPVRPVVVMRPRRVMGPVVMAVAIVGAVVMVMVPVLHRRHRFRHGDRRRANRRSCGGGARDQRQAESGHDEQLAHGFLD
ncbi:hypothetical protein [Roseococcus sp. SYP-B2431]|uniref:hypothetical protein n=1 Tax=Roseococcus sp. SYP-B2431 TaxID=2496640 RepID=UPI0013F3EB92|nr:hypothetical protein [Roseococcus sp. SYP-B2431]